jgi:hypothetical protein
MVKPWWWLMQVGDAAMVLSLSSLEEVEDRNLLAGSLMVLLEQDINQAQVRKRLFKQPMSTHVVVRQHHAAVTAMQYSKCRTSRVRTWQDVQHPAVLQLWPWS